MSYHLTPTPWFTALDASGNPLSGALLYTYEAGDSTPKTTYSDSIGTPNANPVVCDSAGRAVVRLGTGAYKFVLKTSAGVTVRTEDNIIGYRSLESLDLDLDVTFGATVTAGQCVYLSDGDGGRNAGQWYLTDTDLAYSRTREVGFAVVGAAAGATGQVRIRGIVTGLAGLTAGTAYYTGPTAGTITATRGGRFVGVALSTTTLLCGTAEPRSYVIESLLTEFFGAGGVLAPVDGAYAGNGSYATLYIAAGAAVSLVRRITLTNVTATARTCYAVIVENGGTAAVRHAVFYDTIEAYETIVLEGPWFLDPSDFVRAQASAASAIACRLEVSELAVQPDGFTLVVDDGTLITNALATVFTAAGVQTVVPAITLCNTHTAIVRVDVEVIPSGGAAAGTYGIFADNLDPGETVILPGPVMDVGDFMQAVASVTNVVAARVTAVQEN